MESKLKNAISYIEEQFNSCSCNIKTGFPNLDYKLRGIKNGNLITIAGATSIGKTAFICSVIRNIFNDKNVLYVTTGESENDITLKFLSNLSQVPLNNLHSGILMKHEWTQFDKGVEVLRDAKLKIEEHYDYYEDLERKLRKILSEKKLKPDIVFIDYIQMLYSINQTSSRAEELSYIVRSIKKLAQKYNIPIVIASQLNRNVDSRVAPNDFNKFKPKLSDLRESGSIEQDSDVVIFIHRPEYYGHYQDTATGESLRNLAQIIIAKNRNGETSEIESMFEKKHCQFLLKDYEVVIEKDKPKINHEQTPPQMPEDFDPFADETTTQVKINAPF